MTEILERGLKEATMIARAVERREQITGLIETFKAHNARQETFGITSHDGTAAAVLMPPDAILARQAVIAILTPEVAKIDEVLGKFGFNTAPPEG